MTDYYLFLRQSNIYLNSKIQNVREIEEYGEDLEVGECENCDAFYGMYWVDFCVWLQYHFWVFLLWFT